MNRLAAVQIFALRFVLYALAANVTGENPQGCTGCSTVSDSPPAAPTAPAARPGGNSPSELVRTVDDIFEYLKILKPIIGNITKNRLWEASKTPESTASPVGGAPKPQRGRSVGANAPTDADASTYRYSCHECDKCPKISQTDTCGTRKGCGTMVYDTIGEGGRKRNLTVRRFCLEEMIGEFLVRNYCYDGFQKGIVVSCFFCYSDTCNGKDRDVDEWFGSKYADKYEGKFLEDAASTLARFGHFAFVFPVVLLLVVPRCSSYRIG